MRKKQLIETFGSKNNLWYIDIKGIDENGSEVWLSGNTLHQEQFGYGGFYNYESCKTIIDNWERFEYDAITDPEILRHCSEDNVKLFIPQKLYIGFAPLNDEEDNRLFMEREL